MKTNYCLLTTRHLENRLWFRDDEDFKAGMNYIPVLMNATRIDILAFILMSNHVHFVLSCSVEKARDSITLFKKSYSQYYCNKYASRELLRRNTVDIQPLPEANESLERAIAYVHMNCVAANICLNSFEYPWGTGNCFFSAAPSGRGIRADKKSERERIRLTHSRKPLPENAMFDESGYVLPASYVSVTMVESLFRTPKRMNYFLQSSSKAKTSTEGLPSFRDQSILSALPDLCQSLFQKYTPDSFTMEELSELARQIRFRFSSDPHQIARVIGVSYDTVASLLDKY